jgi:hypothetical protein
MKRRDLLRPRVDCHFFIEMTLVQLEKAIGTTAAHHGAHNIRPFVCRNKNPLNCCIFIIGTNPATPMTTDFWQQFWKLGIGFDYATWRAAYNTLGGTSRTRKNIDEIVDTVGDACDVLETNLYPLEMPSGTKVPRPHRCTNVLESLLECILPSVIIGHGKEACDWILKARSRSPASNWAKCILIPTPHLGTTDQWFAKHVGHAACRAYRPPHTVCAQNVTQSPHSSQSLALA